MYGGWYRQGKCRNRSPSLFVSDKFTIKENEVREGTLDSLKEALQKNILASMLNCREDMNRQCLAAGATAMGTNPAGNDSVGIAAGTYQALQLLKSDGTVGANNFDQIRNEMSDNHQNGSVALIGLGKMRKYFNRLVVGGLNDGGVQINEIMSEFGGVFFKDDYATTALGSADREQFDEIKFKAD